MIPRQRAHPIRDDRRPAPLVLVNGLAEQAETWSANRAAWSRRFDLRMPEILDYDGEALHRHLDDGGAITVDYLAGRLATGLEQAGVEPPYHLVGSSLGGQVVLEYAARHPGRVGRLVLIAPSGLHGAEALPVLAGVRRSDYGRLVRSVFWDERFATAELVGAIARKCRDRRWRKGLLRTLRGTIGHSIAPRLPEVEAPCLLIWGAEDRVIADLPGAIRAAWRLPDAQQVVIPRCGHAPQIERSRLVNRLVARFLRGRPGALPSASEPARDLRLQAPRVDR